MKKAGIRINNFLFMIKLFQTNRLLSVIIIIEGITFISILGMLINIIITAKTQEPEIPTAFHADRTAKTEISNIPSGIFYMEAEKPVPVIKPHTEFIKLNLTGVGKVNGIYKASIEDLQGNYFYVREGDKVMDLLVKDISENEVILTDKSGNVLRLTLDR